MQSMSPQVLLMCSFPSKVNIHLRAVSHYLSNRISKLASQTQSTSSMDQLQNGLVQYQPSGSNPELPTAHASGQYQPAGNNETPLAREDLNSDAIVDAQLTHLISRDDASQGQDAPMPQTFSCRMHLQCMISPLRDARLVEDAASGVSVRSLQQANASVPPAVCAEHDSPMARHDSSNGETAKPTITTYMHTVLMADLDMIMNCIRKLLMIRKQLMQSPANGTPSPEQQRIQKFYSLLHRIRIKPQQLLHLTMSGTCLGEKRPSAWMRRSWTSSGSNMLHGTASKTCVAHVRPTSHEVQICVAASPTCHPACYHSQQPKLSGLRISLESARA